MWRKLQFLAICYIMAWCSKRLTKIGYTDEMLAALEETEARRQGKGFLEFEGHKGD